MSGHRVTIAGMGAVTPVGLSAPAACAALRASVSRMNLLEGWTDRGALPDPPFAAGRVPLEWLDPEYPYTWPGHEKMKLDLPEPEKFVTAGAERLVELALPAAEEAWARAGYAGQRGPGVGLYLGLDDADSGEAVADALGDALKLSFDIKREDSLGRASGLTALHRAVRHLQADRVRVAIVGGVDSLLRRAPVVRLKEQGRLKSEKQPHGVMPGEAAAFVVLEASDRGHVSVARTAVGEEPTARTGEPCKGAGLARVLREAGADLETYPMVVCDLNGERYRHIEWGYASTRAFRSVPKAEDGPQETDLRHPADCVGDTGAASGILNTIWAATALREGYAKSDQALVWGASDGVLRAAACLARS